MVVEVSRSLVPMPAELFPADEVARAEAGIAAGTTLPADVLAGVEWEAEYVVPRDRSGGSPGLVLLGGLLSRPTLPWLLAVVALVLVVAAATDWSVLPVYGGVVVLVVAWVWWRLWVAAPVPARPGARYRQGLRGDVLVVESPWQVDLVPVEDVGEWLRHDGHVTLRAEGLELTVPAALFPYAGPGGA